MSARGGFALLALAKGELKQVAGGMGSMSINCPLSESVNPININPINAVNYTPTEPASPICAKQRIARAESTFVQNVLAKTYSLICPGHCVRPSSLRQRSLGGAIVQWLCNDGVNFRRVHGASTVRGVLNARPINRTRTESATRPYAVNLSPESRPSSPARIGACAG